MTHSADINASINLGLTTNHLLTSNLDHSSEAAQAYVLDQTLRKRFSMPIIF